MKVLITGATGFLGKRVLTLLVQHKQISHISVITRSKTSHPSAKVTLIRCDLSQPASVNRINVDVDAVIHLAGRYNFTGNSSSNYLDNVVATSNLIHHIKENMSHKNISIHHASTYAVAGLDRRMTLAEVPLKRMPSKKISYAYTKALAEEVVLKSNLPGAIYRLGILVGDSQDGAIEKLDGPYYLMKYLKNLSRLPKSQWIKRMIVPGKAKSQLPLVPVDIAAKVFVEGLFKKNHLEGSAPEIYGVYHANQVTTDEFISKAFKKLLPHAKPFYADWVPQGILKRQSWVTGVPAPIFEFGMSEVQLTNDKFKKAFPKCQIPEFKSYEKHFFSGFNKYMGLQ